MSNAQFSLVRMGGIRVLNVVEDNQLLSATDSSHHNIDAMLEALALGEPVAPLFETGRFIEKKFADVQEGRVTVRGDKVYFDEEPVRGSIVDTILDFLENNHPITPLVNFLDNIMANPQEHSREQFYRWIEKHDFPIDDDGCIVAFKGVTRDHKSLHSGFAVVDNVEFNGQVPNEVGSVISMPRSMVQHDPKVACHTGLHAGTWAYASSFGEVVMKVKINPRDVVSVPNDCNSQKVRVCRYEVIGFAKSDYAGSYYSAPAAESLDDDYDDDDDDFDYPW